MLINDAMVSNHSIVKDIMKSGLKLSGRGSLGAGAYWPTG